MDRKSVAGLVALGFVLGGWQSAEVAQASPLIVTFSGVVSSGIDNLDLFGGGDLAGEAFSVRNAYDFDPSNVDGTSRGTSTIEISGHTFQFNGGGFPRIDFQNKSLQLSMCSTCTHGIGYATSLVVNNYDFDFLPRDMPYDRYYNYVYELGDLFNIYEYTTASFSVAKNYPSLFGYDEFIEFSVSEISVVPLPRSFSMFGAALFALGAATWARRRQVYPFRSACSGQ